MPIPEAVRAYLEGAKYFPDYSVNEADRDLEFIALVRAIGTAQWREEPIFPADLAYAQKAVRSQTEVPASSETLPEMVRVLTILVSQFHFPLTLAADWLDYEQRLRDPEISVSQFEAQKFTANSEGLQMSPETHWVNRVMDFLSDRKRWGYYKIGYAELGHYRRLLQELWLITLNPALKLELRQTIEELAYPLHDFEVQPLIPYSVKGFCAVQLDLIEEYQRQALSEFAHTYWQDMAVNQTLVALNKSHAKRFARSLRRLTAYFQDIREILKFVPREIAVPRHKLLPVLSLIESAVQLEANPHHTNLVNIDSTRKAEIKNWFAQISQTSR